MLCLAAAAAACGGRSGLDGFSLSDQGSGPGSSLPRRWRRALGAAGRLGPVERCAPRPPPRLARPAPRPTSPASTGARGGTFRANSPQLQQRLLADGRGEPGDVLPRARSQRTVLPGQPLDHPRGGSVPGARPRLLLRAGSGLRVQPPGRGRRARRGLGVGVRAGSRVSEREAPAGHRVHRRPDLASTTTPRASPRSARPASGGRASSGTEPRAEAPGSRRCVHGPP